MDPNCIFCKIVAGQIPATLVFQDEDVVAFRDLHPQAKDHILIIPRQHIVSMAELTQEHGPLLVVTNVGPDSGQSVFHLHFHLLGGEQLGLFGKPILAL